MSTTPRTPVHFPKMKVRGRRNKARSAHRWTSTMTTTIAAEVKTWENDTGKVEFVASTTPTHYITTTYSVTHDGWGRRVA